MKLKREYFPEREAVMQEQKQNLHNVLQKEFGKCFCISIASLLSYSKK